MFYSVFVFYQRPLPCTVFLVLCVLHLLSEVGSMTGWLAGVGEDAAGLRSSAGETLVGFVVANSNTNCNMSARGYLVGPEP